MVKAIINFVEEISNSPYDFWPHTVQEKEYATFDEALQDINNKFVSFDYEINTKNQEIVFVVWL